MGKTCTQNYDTKKSELLDPDETSRIADLCNNEAITGIDNSIISKLSGDKTPGFSREALYINGYSPIADLVGEISEKMQSDVKNISELRGQIISEGNTHTVQEVKEFHDKLSAEYSKRKSHFTEAIDKYNEEVNKHNLEADDHNKKEDAKEDNQTKNYMDKWGDPIKSTPTGDVVEDFEKEKAEPAPNPSVPSAGDVTSTEKNYTDAFDTYVQEYKSVMEWKSLPTGSASFGGQSVTIDEKYKTFSKENYDPKEYEEYPDNTKVVTHKNDDGSIEYYRYDKNNKLIELHVVDANNGDHYYTSTGLPATKVEKDNPQSPVIPNSVIGDVEAKDISIYNDAIVVHRRENGKSVFYTYDKDGNVKSIRDEHEVDVTGAALCNENSKYNTTAPYPYEITEEYKKHNTNNYSVAGYGSQTVENDDGSKSVYMYDTKGELAQIHVIDENGNNYYYTNQGLPASKVKPTPISAVIPNAVLDGGEVTTYDMLTVVHRREDGKSVFYTYQDPNGLVSIRDDAFNDIEGQVDKVYKEDSKTENTNT